MDDDPAYLLTMGIAERASASHQRGAARRNCSRPVLVGLTAFLATPVLRAAPEHTPVVATRSRDDVARDHAASGATHFESGRFAEALESWGIAYALNADVELLFHLAEAARLSNHANTAAVFYDLYLQKAPKGARRMLAAQRRTGLRAPPNLKPHVLAGTYWNVQGQRAKAESQSYREAYSVAYALIADTRFLHLLAGSLHLVKDFDTALALYEKYLQVSRTSSDPDDRRFRPEAQKAIAWIRAFHASPGPTPPPPSPPPAPVPASPEGPVQAPAKTEEVAPPPPPTPPPALMTPAVSPPPPSSPQAPLPVSPPTAPPAKVPGPERKPLRWTPYFEFAAGALLAIRRLQFEGSDSGTGKDCFEASSRLSEAYVAVPCDGLSSPLSAGVRLQLGLYPLAGSRIRALRSLGIHGRFDYLPPVRFCEAPEQGVCNEDVVVQQVLRGELGLRWSIPLRGAGKLPSLVLYALYGASATELRVESTAIRYPGLTSVTYQYVDLGFALQVPYARGASWTLALAAEGHYHAMLSYGEIAASRPASDAEGNGYGPVRSGHGVRAELYLLDALLPRHLSLRLGGYYEAFLLGFAYGTPTQLDGAAYPRQLASRARDESFGGVVSLGIWL